MTNAPGNEGRIIRTISTNTLLAEGDCQVAAHLNAGFPISTNTLLAEGDGEGMAFMVDRQDISTNTLLAEGDESQMKGNERFF